MSNSNCENCGKVYNKYLGDRFWSGSWETENGEMHTLCNKCHRNLVRNQ